MIRRISNSPGRYISAIRDSMSRSLTVGRRTLINDLSRVIKKGEKWLLKGANGSGKSTLLSLLNADIPIAYRYDFYLSHLDSVLSRWLIHVSYRSREIGCTMTPHLTAFQTRRQLTKPVTSI